MKPLSILETLLVVVLFYLLAIGKPGLAQIQTESQPLKNILNPNGTLNMEIASNGSFNPEGYQMGYAENGEPIFVSSSRDVPTTIQSGDEAWDDQFYVDGVDGDVTAIAADSSGNIYVGGHFTAINGNFMNYIAMWDGNNWSALGSGVNNSVEAIAISGSDVYVAGYFTLAGGLLVNRVARWDGSSWSALAGGLNDMVDAIAINGSDVYVGGEFTSAGVVSANRVAKWDGSNWSALGSGFDWGVSDITISGGDVFVCGGFTVAGGVSANGIARW